MPGLRLFKRRWDIGSDDLIFPAFFESCIRASWFVFMLSSLHVSTDCYRFLRILMIVGLLFYLLSLARTRDHFPAALDSSCRFNEHKSWFKQQT